MARIESYSEVFRRLIKSQNLSRICRRTWFRDLTYLQPIAYCFGSFESACNGERDSWWKSIHGLFQAEDQTCISTDSPDRKKKKKKKGLTKVKKGKKGGEKDHTASIFAMAIFSGSGTSSLNSASPEMRSAGGPAGMIIRVNHSVGSLGRILVYRMIR